MISNLVSVIMPLYNGERTIFRAVNSLRMQTYQNWECIIINDGSTDRSLEIIKKISVLDERIRFFSFKKNKGRPFARQKGLELAQGEYLAMLDCDDFYHPSKLEIQVSILIKNKDIALVSGGLFSFGEDINFITKRGEGTSEKKLFISGKSSITHAPSMLRTNRAIQFQYNTNLSLGEDIDFLNRYLKGQCYYNGNNNFYFYSEFDSVTFSKIRKTYSDIALEMFSNKNILFIVVFLKLLISYIYFPIVGLNSLLKKRGVKSSIEEYKSFIELKKKLEQDFLI